MSTTTNPPTVEAVSQMLRGALNACEVPHGIALDALLNVFGSLAMSHSCCTAYAAMNTSTLAAALLSRAARNAQAAEDEAQARATLAGLNRLNDGRLPGPLPAPASTTTH